MRPETSEMQRQASIIVERHWLPHMGAIHTMVTAADYDGLSHLYLNISTNIAIEAMRTEVASP